MVNDISAQAGRMAAVATALRSAGLAETTPARNTAAVTLTGATSRTAVLVRIVPQHNARHAFITLISATCRRHRACGWRAHLGADVPAPVVAAFSCAALTGPMPCEAVLSAA